jgi:hypothetical protein
VGNTSTTGVVVAVVVVAFFGFPFTRASVPVAVGDVFFAFAVGDAFVVVGDAFFVVVVAAVLFGPFAVAGFAWSALTPACFAPDVVGLFTCP